MPRYIVRVDENNHYMDTDERWTLSTFDTAEKAVDAAKRLVEISLREHFSPGITSEQLYAAYIADGDDPFVVAEAGAAVTPPFSAWTYAKERAVEMCALISPTGLHLPDTSEEG